MEKRQVIVVLESLKTETVLGAPVDGIVKAFGCPKSEVEESRSWWGLKRTKAIAGVANNVVLYSHPARTAFYGIALNGCAVTIYVNLI